MGGANSSAIIFKGFEGNSKEFEDFSIATKKKPLIFTNTRTKKADSCCRCCWQQQRKKWRVKGQEKLVVEFPHRYTATDSKHI